MTHFHGIFPAVVTPFDSEGRLATASFERLIERLDGQGVHGIYVCGSTGEGLLQTVAQRKLVAEIAVKCMPAGKPVLVHVGAHRLEDAIDLAKHACRTGATAISSLPPHGDYTFAEIREYYQLLAAASDLPMFVYYLPEVYPAVLTLSQVLELCEIRNVIGLKLTSVDLSMVAVLKRHGAVIFNGRDDILVAGLLMGADGGIGSFYNLIPELFLQVYALAKANQWAEARTIQEQINELVSITLRFPAFPAIKTMLSWSGIDCGTFLPPRRQLTVSEEAELRALLSQSSFASSLLAGAPAR
jgi:N-acetylneuraminate lyase